MALGRGRGGLACYHGWNPISQLCIPPSRARCQHYLVWYADQWQRWREELSCWLELELTAASKKLRRRLWLLTALVTGWRVYGYCLQLVWWRHPQWEMSMYPFTFLASVHISEYVHISIHICIYVYMCLWDLPLWLSLSIYMYIRIFIFTCIYIYIYIYIFTGYPLCRRIPKIRPALIVVCILGTLAWLGCFLQAFCGIWTALMYPAKPMSAIWHSGVGGSIDLETFDGFREEGESSRFVIMWQPEVTCGGLVAPL